MRSAAGWMWIYTLDPGRRYGWAAPARSTSKGDGSGAVRPGNPGNLGLGVCCWSGCGMGRSLDACEEDEAAAGFGDWCVVGCEVCWWAALCVGPCCVGWCGYGLDAWRGGEARFRTTGSVGGSVAGVAPCDGNCLALGGTVGVVVRVVVVIEGFGVVWSVAMWVESVLPFVSCGVDVAMVLGEASSAAGVVGEDEDEEGGVTGLLGAGVVDGVVDVVPYVATKVVVADGVLDVVPSVAAEDGVC